MFEFMRFLVNHPYFRVDHISVLTENLLSVTINGREEKFLRSNDLIEIISGPYRRFVWNCLEGQNQDTSVLRSLVRAN